VRQRIKHLVVAVWYALFLGGLCTAAGAVVVHFHRHDYLDGLLMMTSFLCLLLSVIWGVLILTMRSFE